MSTGGVTVGTGRVFSHSHARVGLDSQRQTVIFQVHDSMVFDSRGMRVRVIGKDKLVSVWMGLIGTTKIDRLVVGVQSMMAGRCSVARRGSSRAAAGGRPGVRRLPGPLYWPGTGKGGVELADRRRWREVSEGA